MLANMQDYGLSNTVQIAVPATYNVDIPLPDTTHKTIAIAVANRFGDLFGGATITQGIGVWSHDNQTITENLWLVMSNCDNDTLDKKLFDTVKIATAIKRLLKQEAVSLWVNGKLYFV